MSSLPRRRLALVIAAAGVVVLLGAGALVLRWPEKPVVVAGRAGTVHRTMATWIPYWGTRNAYATVLRNADLFEYASPFWYRASGLTTIQAHRGAGDAALVAGLHRKGVLVVPTVTLGLTAARWSAAMISQANRAAHVAALVRLAVAHRYDGIDLDYESFARVASAAQARTVRDTFSAVAAGLCARLHALGKRCTITVMARTADVPTTWRGRYAVWIYDYRSLLGTADRLRVMAYDQHSSGGAPGPIAATGWVAAITRYAASKADAVGVPRSRVEIALPSYGYDWAGSNGVSRTSAGMEELRRSVGATRRWDKIAEEWTFVYTKSHVRHVVYYPDATSTRRKLAVVRAAHERYGLWLPLGADPAVWSDAFRPASTW